MRCPFPGRERERRPTTSSSSGPAIVEPGPANSSSTDTMRVPAVDRSVTVAPRHISGPPVSIAGDAFITFPPSVPWARVAREPTIAARVGQRREALADRADGRRSRRGSRARRGEAAAGVLDAAQRSDAVDRDERLGERRLALPCADDEVRAARDRTRAARERRERLVEGGGGGESPSSARPAVQTTARLSGSCDASQTRSGVIGRWRTRAPMHLRDRVRDRARRRHARRLADALRPLRPGVRRVRLDPVDLDRGASEAVTSL